VAGLNVRITVHGQGPLIDGRAPEIVRTWLNEIRHDVAQKGVEHLRSFVMDKSGPPSGFYESHLRTVDLSADQILIDDTAVYGPWLEGVSARNAATRFKGYRLWRKTSQYLDGTIIPEILQTRTPELIRRLGG
jgi:hypothetical protein